MKIIEQINEKDPQGKWMEYEPRPRSNAAAQALISRLRRYAINDKSSISEMKYRIRTINA